MKKEKSKKNLVVLFMIVIIIVIIVVGIFIFLKNIAPTTISQAKKREYSANENITLMDDYGNYIVLPAGFKIALDSESVVTKGIVIEDVTEAPTKGSQFVWVPVTKQDGTKIKTSESDIEGTDNPLDRYFWTYEATYSSIGSSPIEFEGYEFKEETNANTGKYGNAIAKDIEDFCVKVKNSGGFYIGRYEASKEGETIAVKENQEVYANITQMNASTLCQEMYKDKPFSSDLINSYAWDTALAFIQKCGGYEKYSTINASTKYGKTGENGDEILKINDMSGNLCEWTTESLNSTEVPSIIRGGYFYEENVNEAQRETMYRNAMTPFGQKYISFRPILYM